MPVSTSAARAAHITMHLQLIVMRRMSRCTSFAFAKCTAAATTGPQISPPMSLCRPPCPFSAHFQRPPTCYQAIYFRPLHNDYSQLHNASRESSEDGNQARRSLTQRVREEVVHYWNGFKQLGVELRQAAGLVVRSLRGQVLTRREQRLLVRSFSDFIRSVPFSVSAVAQLLPVDSP